MLLANWFGSLNGFFKLLQLPDLQPLLGDLNQKPWTQKKPSAQAVQFTFILHTFRWCSGLVFCPRTFYTQRGCWGDLTCELAIMMLSVLALSHPAKHIRWSHISRPCVTVSLKAYIDYYHLQKAPCITEQSLRIKNSTNNWVHGRVNVKLFARHSWAVVFFSISLMCQSYSSRLCANSYWIFIKTQTNSNRCASGVALKINLLNSTKLPP